MIKSLYTRLSALLDVKDRSRVLWLMLFMVVVAVLEAVGIALVLPFMALVADSNSTMTSAYVKALQGFFPTLEGRDIVRASGILIVIAVSLRTALSIFTQYYQNRLIWYAGHNVSCRLLERYLSKDYEYFSEVNTSILQKNILSETQLVMTGVLNPLLSAGSRLIIIVAIIGFILLLDPFLTALVVVIFLPAYVLIFFSTQRMIGRFGQLRTEANADRFKIISEAFSGIKEIKAMDNAWVFTDHFKKKSQEYVRYFAITDTIANVPRYLIEGVAFVAIVVFALSLQEKGADAPELLALLAAFSVAGFRLIPYFQDTYRALSSIKYNLSALDLLATEMSTPPSSATDSRVIEGDIVPIPVKESISVQGLEFGYRNAARPSLSNISMNIQAGQVVGIVGTTGAGKSTLVDIFVGLLQPMAGTISVDGSVLDAESMSAWRRSIGYVSQDIFLFDDSILDNIAFGGGKRGIDNDAAVAAAKAAGIHDFIVNELPKGYETPVGERGIRLSGGQKQRIGLARALYRDPSVLILDEATSSLDAATESKVMETIRSLTGRKTIIMVAHRLATVRNCDEIFVLADGRVVDQGTYDELLDMSETFRSLANA